MSVGFSYREELTGTYHWLDDPFVEQRATLRLDVVSTSIPETIRDRRLALAGEIDLEGFVEGASVAGSVGLKLRERRIPYEVSFSKGGRAFRLLGEKDLHPALMEDTLALLPLSIFDEQGYELGRARLRVPWRHEGLAALLSLRLRWFETKATPSRAPGAPFAAAPTAPLR